MLYCTCGQKVSVTSNSSDPHESPHKTKLEFLQTSVHQNLLKAVVSNFNLQVFSLALRLKGGTSEFSKHTSTIGESEKRPKGTKRPLVPSFLFDTSDRGWETVLTESFLLRTSPPFS